MQTTINNESRAEDIFLAMAMKDEMPDEARTAYGEFYKRYAAYLMEVCILRCKIAKDILSEVTADQLFSNILFLVYENAASFLTVELEVSEKYKNDRVKAWLGKLIDTELQKIQRNIFFKDHAMLPYDESIPDLSTEDSDPEEINDSEEMKLFEEAWTQLDERQQEILLASYRYRDRNQYTPTIILDKMVAQFGLSRDNIRQIIHRAKDKILTYINNKITNNYENDRRQQLNERRNL